MTAYYNENDKYCAQWLRNLMSAGLIAKGEVDDRSILDVRADDLRGFAQCHFFAGLGGWPRALRLAQWPDTRPVWTGSCPCQPFSTAGNRKGAADERHLWPHWFRLIRECKPAIVFGEQVASAIGSGWLDPVAVDLEVQGYAVGSAVLPACAVDAPHRRDRLWFVAESNSQGEYARAVDAKVASASEPVPDASGTELRQQPVGRGGPRGAGQALLGVDGEARSMAHSAINGWGSWWPGNAAQGEERRQSDRGSEGADVADADEPSTGQERLQRGGEFCGLGGNQEADRRGKRVFSWPPESGFCRVAHGIPARVAKLRALGNAIVPQVAAEFIGAYLDTRAAA